MQAKPEESEVAPRPVLKWAGGKWRLAPRIAAKLPEKIDTYFEPFVGSAAVFFHMAGEGRFRRAVLGDNNTELVCVYRALKTDVERVITVLNGAGYRTHSEEAYYRIRALVPTDLSPAERAARTIYLNKTGYNGLYRVNRSGQFNVPFGRHKNPTICNPARLRAAAKALARVKLDVADFEKLTKAAKKGDAVYFDPPYVPLSRTSSFTAYSKDAFEHEEHERLSRVFASLASRGVSAVLSNSDTPFTRKLYAGWESERVIVPRPINSDSTKRGGVQELLVQNVKRGRAAQSRD